MHLGQIVLFVAAMSLGAALAPAGATAVGTLMSIVDQDDDTDIAKVDTGKLRVGDGAGALTVDGAVTAQLGIPAGQSAVAYPVGSSKVLIAGRFTSTQRYAISSLTYYGSTSKVRAALYAIETVSGNCSSSGTIRASRAIADVPAGQTVHLTYPHFLIAPFGNFTPTTWCLYAGASGGSYVVTRVGHLAQ